MFKKRSLLLQKVSIFISRMRKPIIPRIISLKKSRKMKKFMLLRPCNYYGYVKEYEFSPSSSPPLFQNYYRNPMKKKKSYGDLLFLGKCLGIMKDNREGRRRRSYNYPLEVKVLPSSTIENSSLVRYQFSEEAEEFSGEEDDDSIDEKAEKFIERFYEEIRLQRQDSFLWSNA